MPFPFTLPTTSSVLLNDFFSSTTHPSLPLTATTRRSVVKDALKKHKRLSAQSKDTSLSNVQDALEKYIPYLLALNTASSYRDVANERVDVEILKPLQAEWRTTLSETLPGREAARPELVGLHNEIAFIFSTLAYVQCLLARSQLKTLYGATLMSSEQRTAILTRAMKHLLEANAIHTYLLSLPSISATKDVPSDIQPSTISALASLALAEATLIMASKGDPYAAAVADDRNEQNNDWMFKAPTITKVRAKLCARMCIAAGEHASQARALLSRSGNGKIDEDLVKYIENLRRSSRGKAARFLAIDQDLEGQTSEALAWLKGARFELGLTVELEDGKRKGWKGLKHSWQEKREDKKIEKGGEWGLDAGKYEEARVVEMLEAKWERLNSTVNVQAVPSYEPLLANSMPSGREGISPQPYSPSTLDGGTLAQMRAPPDPAQQVFRGDEEDSGDEAIGGRSHPVGAFPGTETQYGTSTPSNSYY